MSKPARTVVEYRSYYLPMPFPVLLLSGDYWKISDVPSTRLHFHNCLEIGICHSDSGILEVAGQQLSFRAGDITVLPRNVPHTTYSTPGTRSHWSYLFLDPKELLQPFLPSTWTNYHLSPEAFPSFRYVFSKEDFPCLHHLAQDILRELETQRPCYQICAKGLLLTLYIELYRIQSAGGLPSEKTASSLSVSSNDGQKNSDSQKTGDSPKMQEQTKSGEIAENALVILPALNYIDDNYMQALTIEQLAALCHWCPTHFRRVFQEIMGVSPLAFINSTRINHACVLLRSTERSILDISEAVGFRSISSFNRHFIQMMQMSPREYRSRMQQYEKKFEKQSIQEFRGWMRPE